MNILFLDIDGVLNCPERDSDAPRLRRHSIASLDSHLLSIYRSMIARLGVVVVLSSTWRLVSARRRRLVQSGIKFDDITPCADPTIELLRGTEIQMWLNDFPVVKRYAILDDGVDLLDEQMPNFFQTSPGTGLTRELADQVVAHFAQP